MLPLDYVLFTVLGFLFGLLAGWLVWNVMKKGASE